MVMGFGKGKDGSELNHDEIEQALSQVLDANLNKPLTSLGWIRDLEVKGRDVRLGLGHPISGYSALKTNRKNVENRLRELGAQKIKIEEHLAVPTFRGAAKRLVPGVANLVAVASGKGGVGKSTVAINLAIALAKSGFKTGLLDCDIYGPSLPALVGVNPKPRADARQRLIPNRVHGLTTMSMGYLLNPGQAATWRGPMLHKMVQQFLFNVVWDELDFLILDLPPGTGDVQLSLTQESPLSAAVVVTTPQEAALADARKGVEMFAKVDVPVLGFVENMSEYICRKCGKTHHLFQKDGGQRIADSYQLPLLAKFPLDPSITDDGGEGRPLVARAPKSEAAAKFFDLAESVCLGLHKLNADWTPTKPQVMEV